MRTSKIYHPGPHTFPQVWEPLGLVSGCLAHLFLKPKYLIFVLGVEYLCAGLMNSSMAVHQLIDLTIL